MTKQERIEFRTFLMEMALAVHKFTNGKVFIEVKEETVRLTGDKTIALLIREIQQSQTNLKTKEDVEKAVKAVNELGKKINRNLVAKATSQGIQLDGSDEEVVNDFMAVVGFEFEDAAIV